MSSIRPETLSDKELLKAGYILWNDETGMPILFQKELLSRCAGLLDKLELSGIANAKKQEDPKQLRLFED
jgi:hypothetical protein